MNEEQRKLLRLVYLSSTIDFPTVLDAYHWARDAAAAVAGVGSMSCEEVLAATPASVIKGT